MTSKLLPLIARRVEERIWHRKWSDEETKSLVGDSKKTFFSYAADPSLRTKAASGGSTSALLLYLLESKKIDGALVLRTIIKGGKARPQFFIATSAQELMAAQGSKYSAVFFAQDAFPLIKSFTGTLAIVALPCDAMILARHRKQNKEIDQKIRFVFSLICGHNSEPELTDAIVTKLRPKDYPNLQAYDHRFGHWRGNLKATFDDNAEIVKPFSFFSDYRNLYFYAQPKCHHCFDHFGYYCDISFGDVWSPQMRQAAIKHTALIARTETGVELIREAMKQQILVAHEAEINQVLNGQARTAPFHHNISSRSKVGRWFGIDIKDELHNKVRLVDYLIALIALTNQRFSATKLGKRIIPMLPRPLVKLYLYFFKGLESL